MARDDDDDDRGWLATGAIAAVLGLAFLFLLLITTKDDPQAPVTAGTATATTSTAAASTAPGGDTTAATTTAPVAGDDAAQKVAQGLEECTAMDRASGEQVQCARRLVGTAQAALVDGIRADADPETVKGLWENQARAMAMGLGAGDDPSQVYAAGSLPQPSQGASANTVTCTPRAGARRNLRAPGTENRPSALAVVECQENGAVALVALFRNSGGYYADGTASDACDGARCTVQAPSSNRRGRYRSYVVAYNRNGQNEAGPITDTWSPEQRYCNPPPS